MSIHGNQATSSSDARQSHPADGQTTPSSDSITTPSSAEGPIPSLQEVLLDTTRNRDAEKERGLQINAILSLWCLNPNLTDTETTSKFFIVCKATPEHYLRCLKWVVCMPDRWFTVRAPSRKNFSRKVTRGERDRRFNRRADGRWFTRNHVDLD
jgi:hypothetical protein